MLYHSLLDSLYYETLFSMSTYVPLHFEHKNDVTIILDLHRATTDASKFNDYMGSTLSKIESKNKIICIMGDFNFNLLSYGLIHKRLR